MSRTVRRLQIDELESRMLLAVGDVAFSLSQAFVPVDANSAGAQSSVDLVFHVEGIPSVQADAWSADVRIEPTASATGTVQFVVPDSIATVANLPPAQSNPILDFDLDAGGKAFGFDVGQKSRIVALNWVRLPATLPPPTTDAAGNITLPDGSGLVSLPLTISPDASGVFDLIIVKADVTQATNPDNKNDFEFLPRGTDADGTITVVPDNLRIVSVRVGNTTGASNDWSAAFLNAVDASGTGYPIPRGSGQLASLPWGNIRQIYVEFSEDVGSISPTDVQLIGVNRANYIPSNVSYDAATRRATIVFDAPLPADKYRLIVKDTVTDLAGVALDGEWTTGQLYDSGNGVPGGDFEFRFNVLPGDVDQNGRVSVSDVLALRNGLGAAVGAANYTVLSDLNGSGTLGVSDVVPIRTNLGLQLPVGEPTAAAAEAFVAPSSAIDAVMASSAVYAEDDPARFGNGLRTLRASSAADQGIVRECQWTIPRKSGAFRVP